jgi:hypothetical protein
MPTTSRHHLLLTVVTGVALTAAAGCSASASVGTTPSIAKNTLASKVSATLAKKVGRAPDSVTCPKDLKGKVGTTTRCKLTDGGSTYGVTVTVTKVKGKDVAFAVKVDSRPES